MLSITGAVLAIGLLIIVHEAGHYFVARWCKMRVDRFSIGFGPALIKWRRGDTQFQIAPIPFGGFVQIAGMATADEVEADDPHVYPNRPVWQRFAAIFAGPAMNYVFAVVIALVLFLAAGMPPATARWTVGTTAPGFDAHGKLMPRDQIVSINDHEIYARNRGRNGVHPIDALARELDAVGVDIWLARPELGPLALLDPAALVAAETETRAIEAWRTTPDIGPLEVLTTMAHAPPVDVTVLRDGQRLTIPITTRMGRVDNEGTMAYRLGILLEEVREPVGVGTAASEAVKYPVRQTVAMVSGLVMWATGEAEGRLSGVVGITSEMTQQMEFGWIRALEFLMMLNVALGLINLLPLPALDGGRLAFLTYEMATRRRVNQKIEAAVHMVGIMALLVLMIVVTYNDIARLIRF
jgi:regulator of sigma E protease